MRLVLKPWRFPAGLPVEAACLSPDRLGGRTRQEIAALPILVGNRPEPVGDLFDIDMGSAGGSSTDGAVDLVVDGDLSAFALVGAGMTRGRMTVRGAVGPRAGSAMRGGVLQITGDAGPRAAEGMTGGALIVDGSAGHHLAAPLAGRAHGLDRGTIIVRGDAGAMAGFRMRRGILVIGGDAGPGAGTAMIAGTIVMLGAPSDGAGALMKRGTIVAARPFDPLSVFLPSGRGRFPFLRLYEDALVAAGVPVPAGMSGASYTRFVGDISGGGQGEILIMEAHA
jgi:formylmethanofuran dehydrogenase subunit C